MAWSEARQNKQAYMKPHPVWPTQLLLLACTAGLSIQGIQSPSPSNPVSITVEKTL